MEPHAPVYLIDRFSVLRSELDSHIWLDRWRETIDITVRDDWRSIAANELVLCCGDLLNENARRWMERSQPALYIGRGYLGNHLHKQRQWWRITANGWANTTLMAPPFSRWNLLGLPRRPWMVNQVKRVLIAPSKMTSGVWSGQAPHEWAEEMAGKFPGADIRIRPKTGKPGTRWASLWGDLDWADMVVSQSSAITVEALWWGKKAFSLEPCPTWAAGDRVTFDNWENPEEPKFRDLWHEHIAWSQYTNSEWESGGAIRMFSFYIRGIQQYQSNHQYQFTY